MSVMMNNHLISVAFETAYLTHFNQADLRTRPYFMHIIEIAADVTPHGVEAVVLALIHDTIEDGPESLHNIIRDRHKNEPVIAEALEAITRRTEENYLTEYIPRVKQNALARVVKIADLRRNLQDCPSPSLTRRYQLALAELEG
jgi:(p)ppGpp synthase/HD superfamily hydrolase